MNQTPAPAITVRPIDAELTHPLRHRVLRPHQGLDEMAYPGDTVPGALHLGAFDAGGEFIGIASLAPERLPEGIQPVAGADGDADRVWRLRGMAVAPEQQSNGIGGLLVTSAIERGATLGRGAIWCNARIPAERFYLRLGFVRSSAPFEIDGIGIHVVMQRSLVGDVPSGADS